MYSGGQTGDLAVGSREFESFIQKTTGGQGDKDWMDPLKRATSFGDKKDMDEALSDQSSMKNIKTYEAQFEASVGNIAATTEALATALNNFKDKISDAKESSRSGVLHNSPTASTEYDFFATMMGGGDKYVRPRRLKPGETGE
jgi:hypothetical protein